MKDRIVQYFNQLFEDAPKTRKALELKQEMLQNALDRYEDLVQEGHSGEDAYQNVIQSIGDVTELFEEVEEKNLLSLSESDRKKKALLQAIAVGLYILACVVFFGFALLIGEVAYGYSDVTTGIGLVLAGLICIPPTVMMVYAANMYPVYKKQEKQDMVEEYKEEKYRNNKDKAVMGSVSTLIWTLVLVAYFIISFNTGAWYITWVIFLIGGSIQSIVSLAYSLHKDKNGR